MSSETNGLYHGNEPDSHYPGGTVAGPTTVLPNSEYRGESNGRYRAVDASAPYHEQYPESTVYLSRRPISSLKGAIRSGK